MSYNSPSDLYELIYVLSSSEKRYIKLNIQNNIGASNELGVQLFNLIAKNEGRLIKEIEKKISFTKHPSKLKNGLYKYILTTLEIYSFNTSINIRLRKITNQVEILYDKGLYKQCIVLAKKGLIEAEKIEGFKFQIDIIDWYLNALRELEDKDYDELQNSLLKEQLMLIDKLRNNKEYLGLKDRVFRLLKKAGTGTFDSEKTRTSFKEILKNSLLQDYSLATSFSSKHDFNSIHADIYEYLDEFEKANHYRRQSILLYNEFPQRIKLEQYNYVTSFNNCCLGCIYLKDYDLAEHYFEEMMLIVPNTKQIAVKIFEYVSANRLDMYLQKPDLGKGLSMVDQIEKGFEEYEKEVSPLFKSVIYNNISYLFFATQDYKRALKYNNLILDQENTIYRSDIFRFARIMNLLIHYELGGDGLSIDYFYKATKRYLKKLENNYQFEKWFIIFFGKLLTIKRGDKKTYFQEQELSLLELLKQENERKIIDHFNILAWLRTKHDSISFEEAIKSYVSQNYLLYYKTRKAAISQ